VLDHGGQPSLSILTARRGSRRETVIGVRARSRRAKLGGAQRQIAADRCIRRNPDATGFDPGGGRDRPALAFADTDVSRQKTATQF
jgi:hypothetical protein